MVDSRQYWMDKVLRQVAEDDMNPDDRSLGMRRALTAEEEAMSQAVLAEREEPYMGNLGRAIGAIRDFRFPSGPQVPLAGIRGVTPTVGAGDLPNVAKDMALPLLASDLGVAGTMANVPIPFPSMGKKPVKGIKKKLTPKEIRARKDKETIKKEQEAVRSNKLFSDSLNHDLEIRELSRTQYDELINDGWKHQDIMNEHPVIPSSVRRKGREWLDGKG